MEILFLTATIGLSLKATSRKKQPVTSTLPQLRDDFKMLTSLLIGIHSGTAKVRLV